MGFKDLEDFFGAPVELTIRGRTFSFPGSVSARTGLRLRLIHEQAVAAVSGELDPSRQALSDAEEEQLFDAMLGEAKEQLLDYASQREYELVRATLFNVHMYGREIAERVWNSQGEAVAPGPAPAKPRKQPARLRGSRAGSTKNRRQGKAAPGRTS